MAFADIIRTTTYTANDVADTIENTLDYQIVNASSAIITSTTSTTYVALGSMSCAITIPANESWIVRFNNELNFSCNVTDYVTFLMKRGATNLREVRIYTDVNSVSGNPMYASFNYEELITAGSYIYSVDWKATSGTAYSASRYSRVSARRVG